MLTELSAHFPESGGQVAEYTEDWSDGQTNGDRRGAFWTDKMISGCASFDPARLSAVQHTRNGTDFYGPAWARRQLAWGNVVAAEGEHSRRPSRDVTREHAKKLSTIDGTG